MSNTVKTISMVIAAVFGVVVWFVVFLIPVASIHADSGINNVLSTMSDLSNVAYYSEEDASDIAAQKAKVDKIVQARKKQAIKKGLFNVGQEVAIYLGCLEGMSWQYENNGLQVKCFFLDLVVSYQGKEVFRTSSGEVKSYIPGDEWENQLLSLQALAKRVKEARECKEAEDQMKKDKAAFGLSDADIDATVKEKSPEAKTSDSGNARDNSPRIFLRLAKAQSDLTGF